MSDCVSFVFDMFAYFFSLLFGLPTLVNIILAIPLGYALRRVWHKCFTEFDRSILIRLSEQADDEHHHPSEFNYTPIIVGTYPFSELDGKVESNLDSRNVVGFVIGEVQWLDNPYQFPKRLGIDSFSFKPGYYAYCVIQWEHAYQVRRFFRQGFGIRKIRKKTATNPKENAFIGFGTESSKGQEIIHWQDGLSASMRYQPYNRAGFKAMDIRMRQLAFQTRALIWLKNFKTKEWDNAWR